VTDNADEKILSRAREIQEKHGGSLTDAMVRAEDELRPRPEIQTEFDIHLTVKPRVGAWIAKTFPPAGPHSTEDRLAAFLSMILSREKVRAIRNADEAPEIGAGGAVSMTRQQFIEKAPKE